MGTERKIYERDRHDTDSSACLVAPRTVAAGTWYTPTVDMAGFDRCLICILGGESSDQGATLAVQVQQATAAVAAPTPPDPTPPAAATGLKALAGAAGAKVISDSGTGNYSYAGYYYYYMDRKWLIHVKSEEMDVDNGFRYLQVVYTVSAGDSWNLAMEAVRSTASYEPVATTNITQVVV